MDLLRRHTRPMESFGDRLKALRRVSGLTQEAIALEVGLSKSAVSGWELNVSEPSIAALRQLSRLLGVTVDELVGESRAEARKAFVLSAKERRLIELFRELTPAKRAAVMALLDE